MSYKACNGIWGLGQVIVLQAKISKTVIEQHINEISNVYPNLTYFKFS